MLSCENALVRTDLSNMNRSRQETYSILGCSLGHTVSAGTDCNHLAGHIGGNHHNRLVRPERLGSCCNSGHIDHIHRIAGSSDLVERIGLRAGTMLRLDGSYLLVAVAGCSNSFVASAARDSRPARQGRLPKS